MINKDNNRDNLFTQLIESNSDTYQDLKIKNKKLREIIIKITEEIKALNTKIKTMEKEFTTEKQLLLDKLDKITNNYKLYAEGYKEKAILKKDIGTLINNYKQNNKVLNSFKDSFSFLLKKNMTMYYECKNLNIDKNNTYTYTNKNDNGQYYDFIIDIKNKLFNNIIKYKKSIDMINFPDFYKEYLTFVENEEQKEKENNKNIYNKYKNNSSEKDENKNRNNKYINKRKSFGEYKNKYSFTKIDLNSKQNKINDDFYSEKKSNNKNEKEKKIGNNKSYKDTNFYRNYFFGMNGNTYSPNQINYSEYGNYK